MEEEFWTDWARGAENKNFASERLLSSKIGKRRGVEKNKKKTLDLIQITLIPTYLSSCGKESVRFCVQIK